MNYQFLFAPAGRIISGPEHTFTGSVLGTALSPKLHPIKVCVPMENFFSRPIKENVSNKKIDKFSQVACRVWLTYSSWGILLHPQVQMSLNCHCCTAWHNHTHRHRWLNLKILVTQKKSPLWNGQKAWFLKKWDPQRGSLPQEPNMSKPTRT